MKKRMITLAQTGREYPLVFSDAEDKAPFRWQVDAFKKLVPLNFAAIFAEVGCGKSAELIYLVSAHYLMGDTNAMMLFAPNAVYRQWASQQLPEHMSIPYELYSWGTFSTAKDITKVKEFTELKTDKLKVLLINTEALSHQTYIELFRNFIKAHKTTTVIDEATYIKNPEAKRTQNIVMHLNNMMMFGKRVANVTHSAVYRYILTGTPVDGSPINVYSMFNFLSWNFFNCSYTIFRQRYSLEKKCMNPGGKIYFQKLNKKEIAQLREAAARGVHPDVLSRTFGVTETDINYIVAHPELGLPWKNLAELKRRLDPYSYTITLDECFEDAPEEIIETLCVDMTNDQLKVYTMLKKTLYTQFGGREMTVSNKLTLTMRLQQVTGGFLPLHAIGEDPETATLEAIPGGNPKYSVLRDDLEEHGDRPVIIFCRFVAEAEFIYKKLKEDFGGDSDVGLIIGRVKLKEREEILARFDKKEVDFIVATPKCLSLGRNMQVSHIIYFFSLSFSSGEHLQAKGRIRRATQKFPCIYKYITVNKSVDVHVAEVLRDKQDLLVYMQSHDVAEIM